MRNANAVWLLVAILAVTVVASRVGRAGGPLGILVVSVVLIVAVGVLRAWMARRSTVVAVPPPAPRDVTPREPWIGAGGGAGGSAARSERSRGGPEVIVVEQAPPAAPPLDELEQRLHALERLRTNGLMTDEEYEAKRARLIAEF